MTGPTGTDDGRQNGARQDGLASVFAAVAEAEAAVDELKLALEPRNDIGNARRLIARHGRDMIYVDGTGWMIWDGRRWSSQGGEPEAMKRAHLVADAMVGEVKALEAETKRLELEQPEDFIRPEWLKRIEDHGKWRGATGNSAKVDAMLRTAMPYLRRLARDLDDRPFLLNVANGTLELPTELIVNEAGQPEFAEGQEIKLRPPQHDDLITRICNVAYDPAAQCPQWLAFLEQIVPDKEIQVFLQTWFGYVLTGDVSEQQLLMAHGMGANGKSTMLDVIKQIMGDYAIVLPIETFLSDERRRGAEATPDIARVPGSRLITASEPEGSRALSESMTKQVTGGEEMTARNLHQPFFEFMPCFKLVLSFNKKPRIRGQDEGIWRRILLVPFNEFIPKSKRDKQLPKRLRKTESAGILNWMLDGYLIWREKGLVAPHSVLQATDEYRSESDTVGEFMRIVTRREKGGKVQANRLFEIFTKWAGANGLQPVSRTAFGRWLSDRHYEKEKVGVFYYIDLALDEAELGQLEGSGSRSGGDPRPDDGGIPDHSG